MCFGVHFWDDLCSFSGFAGTDREKPGYVKFVDRIEKLTDFLENQGRDFRKNHVKIISWNMLFFQ